MSVAPVVTGIGVVGPWGDTAEAGLAAVTRSAGGVEPGWFDPVARLVGRGFRYLPPACWYLLAAGRAAVADAGGLTRVAPDRRAGAVGTTSAVRALLAEVDTAVADGRATEVGPAGAPFFAVSAVATRLSIEHGLKGFTLTMTAPAIAGVEALHAGTRAMATHGCAALVVAATEDLPGSDTGQGAAVLVLEATAAGGYGRCRSRVLFLAPRRLVDAEGRARSTRLVRLALTELGVGPELPRHAILDCSPVADVVAEAAGVAGIPHAGALAPLLLVAGLLAAGGDALVVVAAAEGTVALVRVTGEAVG